MSISLALVPVALVLRVAMGKEKFDNWVESSEIKMPAAFKTEAELMQTVKLAGYDTRRVAGLIKTHLNEEEFFFWENIKGVWTAVFSEYDTQELVKKFISELESKAGRRVIYNSLEEMNKGHEKPRNISMIPPLPKMNTEVFPTNFADRELLLKTLSEYGVTCKAKLNGDIECSVENCLITFHKEGAANYEVEVNGVTSLRKVHKELTLLDEKYRKNIQEHTYNKVVKKLEGSDMNIEKKEVLEDNSILLTISL